MPDFRYAPDNVEIEGHRTAVTGSVIHPPEKPGQYSVLELKTAERSCYYTVESGSITSSLRMMVDIGRRPNLMGDWEKATVDDDDNLLRDITTERWEIKIWDSGRQDSRGQSFLRYTLTDLDFDAEHPIFSASDFAGSPLHANDSDETLAGILTFLSLQRGDTDSEYFDAYNDMQKRWLETDGPEALGMLSHEILDESGTFVRQKALAQHLADDRGIDRVEALVEIEDTRLHDNMYEYQSEEWLVLDDGEADAVALERAIDYCEECVLSEIPEQAQPYFDLERWAKDAVDTDGRGHTISCYDGEEQEQGDYFLYRTN